jgi:hypothetical protein
MKHAPSVNREFSAVLLVALLVLAACCWTIWQFAFTHQLQQLRESRFQFSLANVRATLESGLRLGFAPSDLPGTQALIEQVRAREQGIQSIDVFDPAGRILFTTDQSGVGASLPGAWRTACMAKLPGEIWRSEEEDGNLQCTAVINGYEQVVGGVLLRYRLQAIHGLRGTLSGHWPSFLVTLALLGLLGGMAGWLAVRSTEQRLNALTSAFEGEGDGEGMVQVRGRGQGRASDDNMAGPAASALEKLGQMQGELARIKAESERLDALETA